MREGAEAGSKIERGIGSRVEGRIEGAEVGCRGVERGRGGSNEGRARERTHRRSGGGSREGGKVGSNCEKGRGGRVEG
eukprot:3834772-Rhodomonas_salina.3